MAETIGVIDYGGGNLQNVLNGLTKLGFEGSLVSKPDDLDGVDRLIFPGVGSFGDCVAHIDAQNLREGILAWLTADRPFFGICLGYQVLFESSEESPGVEGLGFLKGKVVKFSGADGLKVPHMGWNTVRPVNPEAAIWEGLPSEPHLYFVHSYYPAPSDPSVISSRVEYGVEFASSIQQGNLFACQCHPERSQDVGLRLLKNFLTS